MVLLLSKARIAVQSLGNLSCIGKALRRSRLRRERLGCRDFGSWRLAAEILEDRSLLSSPTLDWAYSLGTTAGQSVVNSTAVDSSGDVYIAGVVTKGTVDVDPGSGTTNVTADNQTAFVAKYDTDGSFLWVETYASNRSVSALSLTVDTQGGVFVAGDFTGTTTFGAGESHEATLVNQGKWNANGYLVKLDQSTGDVDWVNGILGRLPLGANNVAVDASGNVYIAGQAAPGKVTITSGESGDTLETFSQHASNYVAKFDTNGGVSWAEGFAEGQASVAAGRGLAVDDEGNVFLAGALTGRKVDFDPGSGTDDLTRTSWTSNAFIVKLNTDGDFQWATKDDATGRDSSSATSIAHDGTGNVFVTLQQPGDSGRPGHGFFRWAGFWCGDWGDRTCGYWPGDCDESVTGQLAKIDGDGNWQWTKDLSSIDADASDDSDESAGDGDSHSRGHHDEPKLGIALHESAGRRDTQSQVSSSTPKVTVDSQGNAIVAGAHTGVTSYDGNGDINWSTTTALPVSSIAVDTTGNVLFVGNFRGTLNVNPAGTTDIEANTRHNAPAPFIAKWTAAPVIVSSPSDQTVDAGASATFTAAATGDPDPTVQWQVSTDGGTTFTDLAGQTSTNLTFVTDSSQNHNQYRAVFTNAAGTATTDAATLTVHFAPSVATQPTDQSVAAGSNATFIAASIGNPTPTVQWQVSTDGGSTFSDLAGATSPTLTFVTAATQNGNRYRANFTNLLGNSLTNSALLTVT